MLAEATLLMEDGFRRKPNDDTIIGESFALKEVLRQVEVVAPTDATVLLHGETGTGKDRLARAVHQFSARRDHPFVTVNCAAIPSDLLESELFGHERGAFTGALARKLGRFELAHQGTLFLDEIGNLPLKLQPKLLRVLQEQTFERLGSTRTHRVDVRVVAATNRDLAQLVEAREFRADLYYRLHVFPILVPPLRQRPEDIPLLVRHFVRRYARQLRKRIDTIPAGAMEALTHYHWPGNVRELQNAIERAAILSPGPVLRLPLAELTPPVRGMPTQGRTLAEVEREYIVKTLRDTRGVVGGPQGGAARLGLKRTTLIYKMEKLGISLTSQEMFTAGQDASGGEGELPCGPTGEGSLTALNVPPPRGALGTGGQPCGRGGHHRLSGERPAHRAQRAGASFGVAKGNSTRTWPGCREHFSEARP
jgi:formate hydrogenlyase transcriptional activator